MKVEIDVNEAKVVIRALATLSLVRPEHNERLFALSNKFMDVLEPDLRSGMPDWWGKNPGTASGTQSEG